MGISMGGMISGLDINNLIDSLVGIENERVVAVQNQQKTNTVKISAYSRLQAQILELKAQAGKVLKAEDFNLFKITSTNDKIATFEAGVGSVEGKYDLNVYQLAQAEKMISANGKITSQTAALSSMSITPGDISIEGVTISIDGNDSIQDLRMKINNAKTAEGKTLGVTASVLKVADNNFRLVLTSAKTGPAGATYKDLNGATLQGLGIINDAAGTKGSETQTLTTANDFSAAFNTLAIGQSIAYTSTDRVGNKTNNLFIKSATSTIDDFLTQVKQTYHGMVDVSLGAAGLQTQQLAGTNDLATAFSALSAGQTIDYAGTDRDGNAVSNTFTKDAVNTLADFLAQVKQTYNGTVDATIDTTGTQAQILTSANDFATAFAALADGETIEYSGTDRDGNVVSNTFIKDTTNTADDFLAQVEQTFNTTLDAAIDGSGKLTMTDTASGVSQLGMTTLTINGVSESVNVSQTGSSGSGKIIIADSTGGASQLSMTSLSVNGVADGVAITQAGADGSGKLTITDKVTGTSQLNMSDLIIGGTAETISIAQAGRNGDGVLAVGRKAYFGIDGVEMESDTNTATGSIAGVTINLLKADVNESVHIEMNRDLDAVTAQIQKVFDGYNALVRFSNTQTAYADPTKEGSAKGDLAGDMTVRAIVSRFRTTLQTRFDDYGGAFSTISQIGVKTQTSTGEYTIDAKKLKTALTEKFDDVIGLFITKGFSDNANISMGRYSADTAPGVYDIEEVDAQYVRMRKAGDTDWVTSKARNGDVVTFDSGPVKGLSLSVTAGILGGAATTFTVSKGLGDLVSETALKVTNATDGIVSVKQKSLREGNVRMDDRVARLKRSVEDYRQRLIKQFTAMEQSMSQMKAQGSSITNMSTASAS
jgi:flagellar hook-associated protein 2